MKQLFLALALLFSAHVARSAPLGAVVQTWHYDPASNSVAVTVVNTSDKDITAFNLSLKVTYASGQVTAYQWRHDFLGVATLLESVAGTPSEQNLEKQVGPTSIPARGSYDQKIPVGPNLRDFEAVLDVVAFSDKTAEATNQQALQQLIASRKAKAATIQKANETVAAVLADTTVKSPHEAAAAKVQGVLDAWKTQVHYDAPDMDEGEFISIVRDLNQTSLRRGNASEPEYLKTYMALKAKEQATWRENARLVAVGGKP